MTDSPSIIYDLIFFSKEKFGGISRMWQELFSRLPQTRIKPRFIVGPADNVAQDFLEANAFFGCPVTRENPRGKLRLARTLAFYRGWQLLHLTRSKEPAIFHSTDYINPLFKRRHLKVVTTIHDMVFWDQKDSFKKNLIYWDKIWSIYHSLKISDRIVTVSETSKMAITRRFPWAEPKITVVYHGISDDLLKQPLVPQKESYFLFVGGRNPYKNYDLLLKAFAVFSRAFPEWRLRVIGENSHSQATEAARYRELGIADKVIDHGFVSQQAARELISKARAVVIPSLNEGFNFPLLEAMACGAPVLSSDIPVSRELGENFASFFNPHDDHALMTLLTTAATHPPQEDALIAAQRHARAFQWEKSVQQLLQIYQSLWPDNERRTTN